MPSLDPHKTFRNRSASGLPLPGVSALLSKSVTFRWRVFYWYNFLRGIQAADQEAAPKAQTAGRYLGVYTDADV